VMRRSVILFVAVAAVACKESEPAPVAAPPPVAAPAAAPALPPGHPPINGAMMPGAMMPKADVAPGGELTWTDAPEWKRETPSSGMRKAQYRIPKVGADTEDGELVVFYFGQGQGGSVDSNVSRWVGQFQGADGQPLTAPTKTDKKTVGTLPVTVVSAEGTFGGGMAMPGGPPPTVKSGYALVGAIAETPGGPWFFKLTGPKSTVAAASAAFDKMVGTFKAQ